MSTIEICINLAQLLALILIPAVLLSLMIMAAWKLFVMWLRYRAGFRLRWNDERERLTRENPPEDEDGDEDAGGCEADNRLAIVATFIALAALALIAYFQILAG